MTLSVKFLFLSKCIQQRAMENRIVCPFAVEISVPLIRLGSIRSVRGGELIILRYLNASQEQQAAATAAVSEELPALTKLLISVVEGPADKKQRAAEALGCACGVLEAVRRLLPDQDVLTGRSTDLQKAVAAKESAVGAKGGKVRKNVWY